MFDSITDRRRPGRRRRAGAALLASLMALSGLGAVGLGSGQRIVAVEDRSVLPLVFEVEAPPPLPVPDGGASAVAVTAPPVAEPPPEPAVEPPALEPASESTLDPDAAVADLDPELVLPFGPEISNGPGVGTGTEGLGTGDGAPGDGPGCEGDCGPAEVHWTQVQVQRQVSPVMPAAARDLGPMEVRCVLRFVVDVKGRPESVTIEQCPALFQQSALSAARRWRFVPMSVDGVPQAATFRLAITYRVD